MSMFERLDRIASRTADRANAIPFILTPMKESPNGRPGYDPERPVVEGRGIFDYADSRAGVELGNRSMRGRSIDLRSLMAAQQPVLSIDRRYFPINEQEPRQGDAIEFPSRPDLPSLQVVSTQRDGLSRLELKLTKAG